MSLTSALGAAVSSLKAIETQMSVASNNITNASTTGYTKETANLVTTTTSSGATGVKVTGITSSVDQYLLKQVNKATSAAAEASVNSSYYYSLETSLGTVSTSTTSSSSTSSTDLSSTLTSLETDLSEWETTPGDSSLQNNVLNDIDDVASQLKEMSSSVQSLRAEADSDVASTVDDANTQLETINELNEKIQVAKAAGGSTAALEDERNTALTSLSGDLGVSSFINSDGNMEVYTTSGQTLVDGSGTVNKLYYAATLENKTTAASSESTYTSPSTASGSGSGISGITVGSATGNDITTSISTGKLAGLINQRDTVLTGVQTELDNLATSLATTLNSITNTSTYSNQDILSIGDASAAASTISGSSSFTFPSSDSDNSTLADSLSSAMTSSQTIGSTSSTFTNYAKTIISDIVSGYSDAEDTATTANDSLSTLKTTFSDNYGVNTDEETANLQVLQNAYAASAQIISTVKSMFSDLITAVES